MANHKRGKAKSARAGCLLCKPHKVWGNCAHRLKPAVIKQMAKGTE